MPLPLDTQHVVKLKWPGMRVTCEIDLSLVLKAGVLVEERVRPLRFTPVGELDMTRAEECILRRLFVLRCVECRSSCSSKLCSWWRLTRSALLLESRLKFVVRASRVCSLHSLSPDLRIGGVGEAGASLVWGKSIWIVFHSTVLTLKEKPGASDSRHFGHLEL